MSEFLSVLNRYYDEGWLIRQQHPDLPLTIWNYSQTTQYEARWDEITLQCRGLVTDDAGTIVARPFRKFFNMEEGKHTATSEFEVYEKMDGSLIIVFWYDGGWIVASRGSFISEQSAAAQKLLDTMDTSHLLVGATYLFELTAPWNRIVVDYGDEEKLTLLGAINTDTLLEAPYSALEFTSKRIGCDVVTRYDGISDYTRLKSRIDDNAEGFVIRFSNGERMKIKGEEYLRLHRIMTELSTKSVWEVLANGSNMESLLKDVPDEFYTKIKEYEVELVSQFNKLENEYKTHFEAIKLLGTRKLFAVSATKFKYPSILFALLDGKDVSPIIWKIIQPEFRKL
jgi:hypothetical protein